MRLARARKGLQEVEVAWATTADGIGASAAIAHADMPRRLTPARRHDTQKTMFASRPQLLVLALLASVLLSGCRDNPEIVLQEARDALKSRDEAAFLARLDPPSRAFLLQSQDVVRLSGQTYEVLGATGFAPDLLPSGEFVEDTDDGDFCIVATGNLCMVEVKKGRNSVRVPMRLVRGQWRIAMLEMEPFLKAVLPR